MRNLIHLDLANEVLVKLKTREFIWPKIRRLESIFFVRESGEIWDLTLTSWRDSVSLHMTRFYDHVNSNGILMHNHPNGTLYPSEADKLMAEYVDSNVRGLIITHMIVVPSFKAALFNVDGNYYVINNTR